MLSRQVRRLLGSWMFATAVTFPPQAAMAGDDPIQEAALQIERTLKATVGYSIHDTGTGRSWQYRADERFPMASTVKLLLCSTLLNEGQALMTRSVPIHSQDILAYAPVTKDLVGTHVPAAKLCAITLKTSDNTAANAVFKVLGGPKVVTAFVRGLGDQTTRSDRNEPSLNEVMPGDERDTTTPRAMANTVKALLLGTALDTPSRAQLTEWLSNNEVGGPLLRAAIPNDWRIADRTGSGSFGARGIAAVLWPPRGEAIVATIYLKDTEASLDERNAAIAAIGRAMVKAVSP